MTTPFRPLPWWPLLLLATLLGGCQRAQDAAHPDYAELVARISPSVVNISTVAAPLPELPSDHPALTGELPEDAPEWFRRYYEQQQGGPGEGGLEPNPQSLGSGFVLWADGYILTNYHVVQDAREVIVRLLDRRQFTAQVVGFDEPSDLALLKIDATGLPAVALGRSGQVRPGQGVLAIGSPFGFEHSVTAGIVSAKERALPRDNYVSFIQTDVAINPGNSGGPLFNLAGDVVGVNSQIYSRTGGFMGLSFAVPIDVALEVAEQLKTGGSVTRGWLGVLIQEVNRDLARSFGLEQPRGALVARVIEDSPADAAGLEPGDIILRYQDHELVYSSDLPPQVGRTRIGTRAELEVLRAGERRTVEVEIAELPREELAAHAGKSEAPPAVTDLGMDVEALDERRRAEHGLPEGTRGVVVVKLRAGVARAAGMQVGDVIVSLDGRPVTSLRQFSSELADTKPGSALRLLVQRGDQPLWVALRMPPGDG